MCRVMSCTYSIWDMIDDLVMRKVNDSDASKFAEISRYRTSIFFGSKRCPHSCCA